VSRWPAAAARRGRSAHRGSFPQALLDELVDETGVTPAVNQIELHPAFPQAEMRAANAARGILTESWSPLEHGRAIAHPTISAIAEGHGCSPAAVVLRWHLDLGVVVIPKAASREHLAANFAALDVALTREDHDAIGAWRASTTASDRIRWCTPPSKGLTNSQALRRTRCGRSARTPRSSPS
jgi:2,5-diketo-D-gluconate reductase A